MSYEQCTEKHTDICLVFRCLTTLRQLRNCPATTVHGSDDRGSYLGMETLFSFPSRLAYLCYTRVCLLGTIFFDLKLRKRDVDSLYLGLDRSCTEVLGSCIGCTHSPVLQVIFTLNYAVCIKVRNRQQCLDPGASIVLTSENSVYRNVTINVLYGAFEFC